MRPIPVPSLAHQRLSPSDWVGKYLAEIRPAGKVLDVACGDGRHANWLAAKGFRVSAVDRDRSPELSSAVSFTLADIESAPWPYAEEQFDAVIVTNYLHRPLFGAIMESVGPAGLLIYETFATGNEKYGRPSRPEFLLHEGELLEVVRGKMTVIAYEHGYVEYPKPAIVQRLAARRSPARRLPG